MKTPRLLQYLAYPQKITGPIIEAELRDVAIGELCEIRCGWHQKQVVARAQVVGLQRERTVLSLIGNAQGLTRDVVLYPTGRALSAWVGYSVLGAVLDPTGKIVERFTSEVAPISEERVIDVAPPSYASRVGVHEPLITGVRAIDGLLTCGVGQRMGIFASAGCGKTMLMHMLIEQTEADVFVIGLIGERGREVTEFVDMLRASHKKENACWFLLLPISPRSIAAMRRNWRQP